MDPWTTPAYAAPALEAVWVIGIAVYIILQRRSAPATFAWVFALAFLPIVGIAVYFWLGPRRYERRRTRRRRAASVIERSAKMDRDILDAAHHDSQLAKMICSTVGIAGAVRHAELTIFLDGKSKYDALEEAIANASHHVHLEYYIFEPDRFGTRIRDLLVERAKAGVEVRVLVDGLGSSRTQRRFFAPLVDSGGQVRHFNEVSFARWRPRMMNFRTHRKIVVIDGSVGFTGGMNLTEVHSSEFLGEAAWRDTHLRLMGPAVAGLQRVFLEDWLYAGDDAPNADLYLPGGEHAPLADRLVQIVFSGPDENLDAIHKVFFTAIAGATERVQLTTPYFVPDETIQNALAAAALGGVDVVLLVPARGDLPLVSAAAESYYPELLESGVRIFALDEPVLHAKSLVVDDCAVVGSANTDNRSFRLNFELAAVIHDRAAADELSEAFAKDLAKARPVTREDLDERGFLRRLFSSTARLFSPLL